MWSRNRQGVTDCLCECLCMCVFLLSSLTAAVWGKIKKRHPNKGCLLPPERGKKENELHYSVLLCCPSLPPPPSILLNAMLMNGSEGEEEEEKGGRGRMGGTTMFCVNQSVSVPWARLWRSPGVCFGFHTRPLMSESFNRCEDNWAPTVFMFKGTEGILNSF